MQFTAFDRADWALRLSHRNPGTSVHERTQYIQSMQEISPYLPGFAMAYHAKIPHLAYPLTLLRPGLDQLLSSHGRKNLQRLYGPPALSTDRAVLL